MLLDDMLVLELVILFVLTEFAGFEELYTTATEGVFDLDDDGVALCCSVDVIERPAKEELDESIRADVLLSRLTAKFVDVDEELLCGEIIGPVKLPKVAEGMAGPALVIEESVVCGVDEEGAVFSARYREQADLMVQGAKDCNSGGVFIDASVFDDLRIPRYQCILEICGAS